MNSSYNNSVSIPKHFRYIFKINSKGISDGVPGGYYWEFSKKLRSILAKLMKRILFCNFAIITEKNRQIIVHGGFSSGIILNKARNFLEAIPV